MEEPMSTDSRTPNGSSANLKWSMWLLCLGGCVGAFLIAFMRITEAHRAAVGPDGTTKYLWNIIFLFFPFIALAGLLTLVSPVLLLVARVRRLALASLLISVSFLAGFYSGNTSELKVRSVAFRALAERSKPIVAAIRKYEMEKGKPPATLEALTPEYLPLVPNTGMVAYPNYEYVVGDNAKSYDNNPWVLFVRTPSGGINFDQFMYFPKQNYPATGYGGWLERLGDWAYVHE